MKKMIALSLLSLPTLLHAQASRPADRPFFKSTPPPVYVAQTTAPAKATAQTGESYVYDQRPSGGYQVLVSREQADSVVNQFKAAYPKFGSPRMLIYVNRELVDTQSGLRLTARNEKVDTVRTRVDSSVENSNRTGSVSINASGNVTVGSGQEWEFPGKGKYTKQTDNIHAENRYTNTDRKQTLADRQTVRDVERLFGRPLRAAGVTLSDQGVATQLISSRSVKDLASSEGEQARKDREALKKIADVAIEVLISSRNVVINEVSGEKNYTVPDIQATAIRLSDAKVLGQAASRDVVGQDRQGVRFGVQEVAEATALALMEDMTLGLK